MHISWLGSSAIKLQVKPFDSDVTIVIDPYKQEKGSFPRSLTADIALYSHGEKDSITISGNPFVITHPGEWEIKRVLLSAARGHNPGDAMLRIDAEQMSVGHLGRSNKPLTDDQLDMLSGVDVLCVPVGGKDCYEPALASKVINMIEPRIVVPMCYQSDNEPSAAPASDFIKQLGAKVDEEDKKAILKKKDLPQEEMRVLLLSKE